MTFWQAILSAVAAVGGIGVIIIEAVKFLSGLVADRLAEKYKNENEKKLERYKAELSASNHISKHLFEKEYEIYKNLFELSSRILNDILIYDGILSSGKRVLTNEEFFNLANQNIDASEYMKLYLQIQHNEIVPEQSLTQQKDKISTECLEYKNMLMQDGFMLMDNFYERFMKFYDLCWIYFHKPEVNEPETNKKYISDIRETLETLRKEVRTYLHSLTIID